MAKLPVLLHQGSELVNIITQGEANSELLNCRGADFIEALKKSRDVVKGF